MAEAKKSTRKKATRKTATPPAKGKTTSRKATSKKRAATSGSATGATKRKTTTRPRAKRMRESADARRQRAFRILTGLRSAYPEAKTALRHRSAYELLVATILSAQCTDERVNMVTPDFFRRYPDPQSLADAEAEDVEALIRSTGFYRNKTKSLLGMARGVCENHGAEIPDTMEALLELPGVARKTANCVLGSWYGKSEGIVVDTHVGRIAMRLRLLTTARDDKDAVKIERDLMDAFSPESWTYLAHALIDHGRQICTARKPKCGECVLADDCPSAGEV